MSSWLSLALGNGDRTADDPSKFSWSWLPSAGAGPRGGNLVFFRLAPSESLGVDDSLDFFEDWVDINLYFVAKLVFK